MSFGLELTCLLWMCTQSAAKMDQELSTFIGSDAYGTELRGTGSKMNLALDRKQEAYFEVRELNGKPTLLLIHYANDSDRCGTVLDIVIAPNPKDVFEFECIDHTNAKRVVVGVHQGPPDARRWKASKAWLIDFEKLKLVPTNNSATCLNYDYSGPDDGSDIRSRAAARVNKRLP